jgi:NTE family protein
MNRLTHCDLVLEGGGAKGCAHAGGLAAFEDAGVDVERVAGTSAGAIVAAAVACGHSSSSVRGLLMDTDFARFKDWRALRMTYDVLTHGGIYKGERFLAWMQEVTGDKYLGDVPLLRVYAFDLDSDEPIELSYRTHPDLSVAMAVRASMSIPLAFRPVQIGERLSVVDGGLARNYPIDTFDVASGVVPRWPTIGFLLDEPANRRQRKCNLPRGIEIALKAINAAGRHQHKILTRHNEFRTVRIPTQEVGAMDFDLTREQKLRLFDNGYRATRDYLRMWQETGGFVGYLQAFRAAV